MRRLEVGDGDRVAVRAARPVSGSQVPADVEQHAARDDDGCRVLDARDEVALARDDVARAAPVPGHAVVEDVAEPVPLRRALQRHRDDVVGAADAVREALVAALRVDAGVGHGVHRVGAAAPALLRAVRVERLRERDHAALAHEGRGIHPLRGVDEVERAEHVVLAPAPPVAERLGARGDLALGVGAVEVGGVLGRRASSPDPSATQRTTWVPRPSIEPVMTSPSRRNRFQCWPLPAGLPVSRRSPGSSGIVCEAPEMSAGMSNSRSLVEASCITSPLSSSRTFRSVGVDERRRHEERTGRQEARARSWSGTSRCRSPSCPCGTRGRAW